MAGFENDVMYAKNADFTSIDNQSASEANGLATNGQLWIGATAVNVGGTHVNVGTLTSPGGTVTIGYSTPNITLEAGASTPTTFTTDSGNASPAANVINILGGPGVTTSGSGSTLTINSVVFTDQGGSTSVTADSGSFATATVTLTTPVSAGLLDGHLLEFVATTANPLTIQFAATQVGHIGNVASSVAGTFVSTAIGDSIILRYQASTNDWWSVGGPQGNWTIT